MPRLKKQRLKRRKDGRYACRYKDLWFYGMTQEEALERREAYKREEKRMMYAPLTVREYAEQWIERAYPTAAQKTVQIARTHLKKLIDAVGSFTLCDVRPSDIKSLYSSAYKGMSDSYIKSAKSFLCAVFDAAQADGYIKTNPARDRTAKPHKGTVGSHRAITPQEREWIETLCTDHIVHLAAMTMLYAGLRPQEMKAAVIERDFDFDREIISLHSFAHIVDRKYVFTTKGKTEKAARKIPLFPPLKNAAQGKKGYVVTDRKGNPVSVASWETLWDSYVSAMETAINGISKRWYGRTKEQKRLAAEGKLPEWVEFTVVPYDLRHSFCTMCRDGGVELHTCIEWMGHTDSEMILKVYDEVSEDRSEKEAEKIKKTFFRCQDGSQ